MERISCTNNVNYIQEVRQKEGILRKVSDIIPSESMISQVVKKSFSRKKRVEIMRKYNRKYYQEKKLQIKFNQKLHRNFPLLFAPKRDLCKELRDQGYNVEGMSRGRKDYLANKDVKQKKQRDIYWADPEKYNEKQKEYKIRRKVLSTLKKRVTKIQRDSPEILKLLTEDDLYHVLPNDKISVYIEKIGDIQEIYINRDMFFDHIELK